MRRPSVRTSCVADNYSTPGVERIIEFDSGATNAAGGLISFRRQDDGALDVHVYRTDPGVRAYVAEPAQSGITLTRQQVEEWVGHKLTDEQVRRLAACIPTSSIPEAVETIVHEGMGVQAPPECSDCYAPATREIFPELDDDPGAAYYCDSCQPGTIGDIRPLP